MQKYHDKPKQYKGYLKSALVSPAGMVETPRLQAKRGAW